MVLKGLTITRGKAALGHGGCINSGGMLSLIDSTVSGCVGSGRRGWHCLL